MNEKQLSESLQKLTGDALLGGFATDALALIRSAPKVTLVDHGNNATTDRQSLLGTYTLRQRRLVDSRTTLPGFEATITSLSKQSCERVRLVTVNIEAKSIALLLDPTGEIIGGYIGKAVQA